MKNNRISAVIFDFDNTLIDTSPAILKAVKNTFERFNIKNISDEEFQSMAYQSARNYFPKIFGDNMDEATEYFRNSYVKLSTNILPFPDAEKVLMFLKKHHIPMIIISNKKGSLLRKEISEHLKWDKYFDLILGSQDLKEDKPSIKPVLYASEILNLKINRSVWFIGDSPVDMICAVDSGCFPVLFANNYDISLSEKYKPTLHFKSYDEILNQLKLELC